MSASFQPFSGETPWEALVNHYSLDIEEESAFRVYVLAQEASPGAPRRWRISSNSMTAT